MKTVSILIVASILLSAVSLANAETYFVNNRTGADRNDGLVETPLSNITGPVKSISRALKLASFADTIIVANTGVPYYDNLSFQGEKHSGDPFRPFRLVGNGATITGAMVVPEGAWREVARDVWKVTPFRKGFFQLVRDGKALPEVRQAAGEKWDSIPDLEVTQWCAWRGSIYYRIERLTEPLTQKLSIARRSCGITVFAAHDIVISDLTIQHFRLDGVNLHDLATNIQLEKMTLRENGRAGLAVGGSSTARMSGSDIEQNRDHSVLIQEAAAVALEDCIIDAEPTVKQR
ncbi:MAG: right-handed parallel beta-helix repeat-containing protein [Planctomycetales bacterium]